MMGSPASPAHHRVLIVYDCLYPWSIGGAERWYRALAERLAAEGHAVTYLTLRQWDRPRGGRRQRWWRLAGLLRGPRRPGARSGARRATTADSAADDLAARRVVRRIRGWPLDAPAPERDAPPAIPGVRVVTVGPRLALYTGSRRRLWPPLRFGLGVGWHLLRYGPDYDVVHTASFPYWPLLAASLLRDAGGYRLLADWWEVWTLAYWRRYAGPMAGTLGWLIQRAAIRATGQAFVFSALHADRLRAEGFRGRATRLRGLYAGPLPTEGTGATPTPPDPAALAGMQLPEQPFILYAGRHIPEKRVPSLIPALGLVRQARPEVVAVITGDGPTRVALDAAVTAAGLDEAVIRPGFVAEATLDALYRAAACLVLPSAREGYGLIVIEAAARGTPSVVVTGPDNAATELIVPGINGAIARSSAAPDLASAILDVLHDAPARRASTAAWFAAHAADLTLAGSLTHVSAAYAATKDDPRACPPLSSPA